MALGVLGVSLSGLSAGLARAQAFIALDDVDMVYQPRSRGYMPQGNEGAEDAAKAVVIDCTISGSGHMQDCHAEDNDIDDPGFVNAAVADVSRWIAARRLKSGDISAGKSFRVTCRFERTEPDGEMINVRTRGEW